MIKFARRIIYKKLFKEVQLFIEQRAFSDSFHFLLYYRFTYHGSVDGMLSPYLYTPRLYVFQSQVI